MMDSAASRHSARWVILACLLCAVQAGAQLYQTPSTLAKQPLLKGYALKGQTFSKGSSRITLDTAGGLVVGVYAESTSPADIARGLGLGWGYQEKDLAELQKQLEDPKLQTQARKGLRQMADQRGTMLIALKLTGTDKSQKWLGYTALNIWPESAFPVTRNVSGKAGAPVNLRLFNDFQCPYCQGMWQDVLPRWENKPGEYRIHHYHFPLDFHKNAFAAAEASECAAEQGQFWPYANKLFQEFQTWTGLSSNAAAAKFSTYSKNVKLNATKFQACLADGTTTQRVQSQLQLGQSLGVNGTPTVFANGIKLQNYSSLSEIAQVKQVTTAKPDARSVIEARLKAFK